MLGDKKRSEKEIEILKDLYHLALKDLQKYDHIFFVPREFGYTQDGVRWQDESTASAVDNALKQFLDSENVKYTTIEGSTKDRAKQILSIVGLDNKDALPTMREIKKKNSK